MRYDAMTHWRGVVGFVQGSDMVGADLGKITQIRGNHPVKRGLTPLQRRGIAGCGGEFEGASGCTPPRQRSCRVQTRCDCSSVGLLKKYSVNRRGGFVQWWYFFNSLVLY